MAYPRLLLNKTSEEFAKELRENANILILPSNLFNIPGNYFRIGFGKKNMSEIINHFDKYLIKNYKNVN